MLYDGDTITVRGRKFKVEFPYDDTGDTPWDSEDGHGPVSEWTTRDKKPGERVLCSDRFSKRFYDYRAAVKTAKAEGWGPAPFPGATRGQTAAHAANLDYERLRRFYEGQWSYVGVVVSLVEDPDITTSLWGIESDCEEFLDETAHDLAKELCNQLGIQDYPQAFIPELQRIGFSLSAVESAG